MLWEGLVEFAGDFSQLRKACPWDCREIVVLIVQADIVGEEVEGSVVGKCFRW